MSLICHSWKSELLRGTCRLGLKLFQSTSGQTAQFAVTEFSFGENKSLQHGTSAHYSKLCDDGTDEILFPSSTAVLLVDNDLFAKLGRNEEMFTSTQGSLMTWECAALSGTCCHVT